MTARRHVVVRGLVQGVGFRWFAREAAARHGVSGWVRNAHDGSVDAEAEGPPQAVERFVAELRAGPPFGRVDEVAVRDIAPKRERGPFEIV